MQKIESLQELFIHQLQDIHTVEGQTSRLIPRMMELAQNPELRALLEKCQKESSQQVERLNESLEMLQQPTSAKSWQTMAGLITEADNLLTKTSEKGVRDAALANIAHKLQQYQIANYNTSRSLAQALGHQKIVSLFKKSIVESTNTSSKFLELARTKLHTKDLVGV